MDKAQFTKMMAVVTTMFNIQSDTKQAMAIWYQALNDLEYDLAIEAVRQLTRTKSGWLYPADIRKACVDVINPKVSFTEAYELLNIVRSKYGRYRVKEGLEYLEKQNQALHKVVKAIGYRSLCDSNPDFTRGSVERMYKEVLINKGNANLLGNFEDDIKKIKSLGLPKE